MGKQTGYNQPAAMAIKPKIYQVFTEAQSATNRFHGIPDIHNVISDSEYKIEAEFKRRGIRVQRIHEDKNCEVLL